MEPCHQISGNVVSICGNWDGRIQCLAQSRWNITSICNCLDHITLYFFGFPFKYAQNLNLLTHFSNPRISPLPHPSHFSPLLHEKWSPIFSLAISAFPWPSSSFTTLPTPSTKHFQAHLVFLWTLSVFLWAPSTIFELLLPYQSPPSSSSRLKPSSKYIWAPPIFLVH